MLESYLIKGLLVGLVFGVPAGAIGALTIQRTLAHGFAAGFVTGLGSSLADVLYTWICVLGLTLVSNFLLEYQAAISLCGGAFIIGLGVMILKRQGTVITAVAHRNCLPAFFGSSFAIAIANPATILAFFFAFSAFGIAEKPSIAQGVQLILGILLGTCCWWGSLSGIAAVFKRRVTDKVFQGLNRILGGLMILFGAAVAIRGFI